MWIQTRIHQNLITTRKNCAGITTNGKVLQAGSYVEYDYLPGFGITRFKWYFIAPSNWSIAGYQGNNFGYSSGSIPYGSTVLSGSGTTIAQGQWSGRQDSYYGGELWNQWFGSAGNGGNSQRIDTLTTI